MLNYSNNYCGVFFQSTDNETSLLRDLKERRLRRQGQLSPMKKHPVPLSKEHESETTKFNGDTKEASEQVTIMYRLP